MASDIVLSGLTATGGAGQVKLTWDIATDPHPRGLGLPYLAYAAGEVFAAPSNDRSLAVKVGEGQSDFLHTGLSRGATYYYWVRARNAAAVPDYGAWFPVSATGGVIGSENNSDYVALQPMNATALNLNGTFNSVANAFGGYWRTPNGLIFQWGFLTQPPNCFVQFFFPIVFPNDLFSLMLTPSTLDFNDLVSVSIEGASVVGGTVHGHKVADGGAVTTPQMGIQFFAVGI